MELILLAVDFFVHLDQHLANLASTYGVWIYAILFVIIFAETGLVVTPFLPGDSLLFVAGALAAAGGMDPIMLALVLFIAAVLGNTTNYWFGRWAGPRVFQWEDSRWFNRKALLAAHLFYEKYGGVTVTLARFLPFVRTFVPFIAGVAAMPHARFQFWSILGGFLWIGGFITLGYFFGNIPVVKDNLAFVMLGVVVVSLLPLIYPWVVRRLRGPVTLP